MGAPKQKWTSEEESALKAGILKHGAGKWRTILKDPEFSGVLSLRSNVDLKDKWRNMSVTANGWGSREKARMALKRNPPTIKIEDNTMLLERGVLSDEDVVDVKPLASSSGLLQITAPKKTISRLDNLIFEAITTLKEPSGSNKTSITMYIEDHYEAPPNFKKILSAKLKGLTSNGKLIKVKRKYRIAPSGALSGARRNTGMPEVEGREGSQREAPRVELTRVQLDAELARMRTMSVREAALAAARAVKEAEAAIAEAEQAALEADEAEADAEAAQAFAEAAMSTLRTRNTPNVMVHG